MSKAYGVYREDMTSVSKMKEEKKRIEKLQRYDSAGALALIYINMREAEVSYKLTQFKKIIGTSKVVKSLTKPLDQYSALNPQFEAVYKALYTEEGESL